MDAFFAAVEQRDYPELRGKPIVVGHDGPRGVVATASYEARRYGLHSAMPMNRAKSMCPNLIIVPHRIDVYKEVSEQVRGIFHEYTDLVEPISIDEAFLDVTENKKDIPLARDVAKLIKQEIQDKTRLTASAGVSYNKLLAKIASDYRKPNGLFVIPPDRALHFIESLPIEKIWGIGEKTAAKMHKMGIFTGGDLRKVSEAHLVEVFGKAGHNYYNFSRGMDNREVITNYVRKSVGCEETFTEDVTLKSTAIIKLYNIVLQLVARIQRSGFEGKTLTLKVKYFDFEQITRSITKEKTLKTKDDILPVAKALLKQVNYAEKPFRLLGLSVSNPSAEPETGKKKTWKEGWLEGFKAES